MTGVGGTSASGALLTKLSVVTSKMDGRWIAVISLFPFYAKNNFTVSVLCWNQYLVYSLNFFKKFFHRNIKAKIKFSKGF